jgi:hypothetical protein
MLVVLASVEANPGDGANGRVQRRNGDASDGSEPDGSVPVLSPCSEPWEPACRQAASDAGF